MPVTLTIKNVPDEIAERLRAIASVHHRSLQGELMAIIEAVVLNHDPGKRNPALQTLIAARPDPVASDNLLEQLDAVVADSRWGDAPILTRSQAHDRTLTREFDFQVQEDKAPYKP